MPSHSLGRAQMGFEFGRVPRGMRFTATGARGVELAWTPCGDDVGLASVCFAAFDAHGAASASSDMKCLQLRVVPDPPPTLTISPSDGMVFTMGRRDSLHLHGRHANCLQALRLDAESALPAGMALLGPEAVLGAGCNTVGRRVEWKPGHEHGGLQATLCFAAAQVLPEAPPDACPLPALKARSRPMVARHNMERERDRDRDRDRDRERRHAEREKRENAHDTLPARALRFVEGLTVAFA
jgi:hypothetical protein